jgi:hypothetical protein
MDYTRVQSGGSMVDETIVSLFVGNVSLLFSKIKHPRILMGLEALRELPIAKQYLSP